MTDDERRIEIANVERLWIVEFCRKFIVIAPDGSQQDDDTRDHDDRDPRTLHELRRHDHDEGEARRGRTKRVDGEVDQVRAPVGLRSRRHRPAPVNHHAGLRQRECQEGADREQRDQIIGDPAEREQEQARGAREIENADREDEPPAGDREGSRQIAILRDHPAQTRKGDEARIGRQRQHAQERRDGDIVQHALADDRSRELRKNAAIVGLRLVCGADAISCREIRDADQEKAQNNDDRRQCAMAIPDRRIAEFAHPVADRLDARHGGAAAGKGPQQQPEPDRLCDGRQWQRPDDRCGMTTCCDRLPHAKHDDGGKARDEDVGRHREQPSGIKRSTQIDQRNERKNTEAERQNVGMQRRDRRHKRPDARGNADRHVEHIVDHQGGRGEQARALPEIVLGDDVGAAIVGIGADRLPIGGEQDGEQTYDRRHHPADVGQAGRPQRDQRGQCGFGPVSR